MKRKLRHFWKEWGISWSDLLDLLGAFSLILIIFEIHIILSFI